MATKKICDRCGKDIRPGGVFGLSGKQIDISVSQELVTYGWRSRKYDLCPECFRELENWLKGGRENEPQKEKEKAKKQVLLRLAPGLWEDLAKWADEDYRSINSQIEYLLAECVRRRKEQRDYDKNSYS